MLSTGVSADWGGKIQNSPADADYSQRYTRVAYGTTPDEPGATRQETQQRPPLEPRAVSWQDVEPQGRLNRQTSPPNPMSENLAIVLAAGKGTRMKSDLPKVLMEVRRRPMIQYVLDALTEGGVGRTIVVVGHRAELVRSTLQRRDSLEFVHQAEQLGTGHAVMACRDHLRDHHGPVLIVAGDSPMMQSRSVAALLAEFHRQPAACILGTACKEDPSGLGRVIRDPQGNFQAIVEEKDATSQQRRITEVNMSYYVFQCQDLLASLDHIRADNSQGEYYVTDCPGVLVARGKEVRALNCLQPCEALSINTVEELASVEAAMQDDQ